MSKRSKFVATALLLSLGFVGINFLEDQYRFHIIGALTLLTLVLFYWSLRESIGVNTTFLTLLLPPLFTLGVGLFWFLLPSNLLLRIPIVIFYGIGIYALALTGNIFSVSTIRTIALVRAARGVGFVLTLFISFLLFDAILSLRSNAFVNSILIFAASLPLFLQGLWSSTLERSLSKQLLTYSVVLSTSITQISILLYFWPVTVVVGSLFLTVSIYVLLGLGQAKLEERLFARTVKEYVSISTIVFIAMFLATKW